MLRSTSLLQGYQSWHPNWVRLARNGSNLRLFKISFSTFWLAEPKCTETDLKKPTICPIWDQSDPIWMPNWHPFSTLFNLLPSPCPHHRSASGRGDKFGLKSGQIARNGTNPSLIQIRFQYTLFTTSNSEVKLLCWMQFYNRCYMCIWGLFDPLLGQI